MDLGTRVAWEAGLAVGDAVTVHWGHGQGFRVSGVGVVHKVSAKSVQVRLTADAHGSHVVSGTPVPSNCGGDVSWPAGTVVKGVPKVTSASWVDGVNGVDPR